MLICVTGAQMTRANSALKLVKTAMGSTMIQDRLHTLILLFIHKDIKLDYNAVINSYNRNTHAECYSVTPCLTTEQTCCMHACIHVRTSRSRDRKYHQIVINFTRFPVEPSSQREGNSPLALFPLAQVHPRFQNPGSAPARCCQGNFYRSILGAATCGHCNLYIRYVTRVNSLQMQENT